MHAHFSRAEEQFSLALTIGQAAGSNDLVTAAYGGRASVRAWQGDWTSASQDATNVPIGFSYDVIFSNDIQNDLVFETNNRLEFSGPRAMWSPPAQSA